MAEYRLPYSAEEIEAILGKVGEKSRDTEISLKAVAWVATDSPTRFTQVVSVPNVGAKDQVDIKLPANIIDAFRAKDITFTTANSGGVVTVSVVGQKPANNYVFPVTLTEVNTDATEIIGVVVTTPLEPSSSSAEDGKSAYDIAVEEGFKGTEAEWLASLKGDPYELTSADKAEIVSSVIDALPKYNGEVVEV